MAIDAQDMLASSFYQQSISGALLDNHLILELQNWFGSLIASMQIRATQ